jgi:hypothetical protein
MSGLPAESAVSDSERCWCAASTPAKATAHLSPPDACQPLDTTPSDICDPATPLPGRTSRTAACTAANGQAAPMRTCLDKDYALAPAEQALLGRVRDNSSSIVMLCTFYDNCGADWAYETGDWSACSATCWKTPGVINSEPVRQRDVVCWKTDRKTGSRSAADLQVLMPQLSALFAMLPATSRTRASMSRTARQTRGNALRAICMMAQHTAS